MRLTYDKLKIFAMGYLALPALIFAGSYLRWYWAVPAILCLLLGFIFACSDNTDARFCKQIEIGRWQMAALVLVILLWTYLGGLNGLFYQSADWPWRNAIYHDLIDMDWPVVYEEKNSALAYYIGFWMPPALVAKLIGAVTGSAVWAWRAARGALWLWSSLGLMLTALVLMFLVGADKPWKQWAAVLAFIFFSGMDIIGAAYADNLERVLAPEVLHLEWWTRDGKQYSAITTCLYWVFNQSIVPWLAVACFLMEKDARNYVFLGMTCMCCGPLPFVGLVICMLVQWGAGLAGDLRARRGMGSVRAALSLPNILMLAAVFPVLGAYYLGNLSVVNTAAQGAGLSLLESIDAYIFRDFAVFFLVDAGIYLALLWPRQWKNPLFYGVAVSLLLIPYFHMGYSEDFCLRASIPGIFILMIYCAEYIVNELPQFGKLHAAKKILTVCLVCALLIGALTPVMEIYRGVYHAVSEGTVQLAQDHIGSIGSMESASNFTAGNYDQTFFFKYMARVKSS